MKGRTLKAGSIGLASAALCLALGAGVALGQNADEVTVTATRQVTVQEVGRSRASNSPIELTTITRHVDYSDLNLATDEGAKMLEQRVHQAVRDECMELDRLHPNLHREATMCMHTVLADTMPQVNTAIEDAKKSSGN